MLPRQHWRQCGGMKLSICLRTLQAQPVGLSLRCSFIPCLVAGPETQPNFLFRPCDDSEESFIFPLTVSPSAGRLKPVMRTGPRLKRLRL